MNPHHPQRVIWRVMFAVMGAKQRAWARLARSRCFLLGAFDAQVARAARDADVVTARAVLELRAFQAYFAANCSEALAVKCQPARPTADLDSGCGAGRYTEQTLADTAGEVDEGGA